MNVRRYIKRVPTLVSLESANKKKLQKFCAKNQISLSEWVNNQIIKEI